VSAVSVIIVGAPRSGTYWLVDLLQTRLGVAIPTETHFIPLFARYLWLWGDLSKAPNRRRLLKSIYEFIACWTVRSSVSGEYREQVRRVSLLVTIDEGRVDQIVEESHDYPSLIDALFMHFADIHGASASGDKSAHYRALDPHKTFGYCSDAKMLHVIRDGRDVTLSWMKEWFGPSTLSEAAIEWRQHVEVNRTWGRANPERYHELRYEDMAVDLEAEINKLKQFLGRDGGSESEGISGSALAKALSSSPSHSGFIDIVAADNVAKWKSRMPDSDVIEFERIAGATLVASGYEASNTSTESWPYHFPQLSGHKFRVAAKTLLPFILGFASKCGVSLLPLINRGFAPEWRRIDI
jgi:hypothetical protein